MQVQVVELGMLEVHWLRDGSHLAPPLLGGVVEGELGDSEGKIGLKLHHKYIQSDLRDFAAVTTL